MKKNRSEWKKQAVPILIAILLLPLIAAGYQVVKNSIARATDNFFYPYLNLAGITADKLSDRTLLAYDRPTLAVKLEQLMQQNRQLALQSAAAAGLLQENRELRRRLNLPPPPDWSFAVGEIILRDPLLHQESFTINRGELDGVEVGAAVVDLTADGRLMLVGVILQTGTRTSKVGTVFNPAVRLSGKLNSNGAVGFINTGEQRAAPGRVRFGFLPERGSYISGEAVLTTGYERGIPGGVKIGELATPGERLSVFSNAPGYLSGELTPAVNFGRLRFLIVVRRSPGGNV